jgi:hypothetical protein
MTLTATAEKTGTCAAVTALLVWGLLAGAAQAEPGSRAELAQIVIGVAPSSGFEVTVDGDEFNGSPVVSDESGIMSFVVDDSGYPPGDLSICFTLDGSLVIHDVAVSEITGTSVLVTWQTNHPADSRVEYGPTESYGLWSPHGTPLVTDHAVELTGLTSGSVYHFRVVSEDAEGGSAQSGDHEFQTLLAPLEITDVQVTDITPTTAAVAWRTSRPATSQVLYGLTSAYGLETPVDEELVSEHSVTLSGLVDGELYHFRVLSEDAYGSQAGSVDATFETLELGPTGPPMMWGVDVEELSATSVLITWSTDRAASSLVRYGTGGVLDCSTDIDTTLVTNHAVVVAPVAPYAEYSFMTLSACGSDTTCGDVGAFRTIAPTGQMTYTHPPGIIRAGVGAVGEETARLNWVTSRPCTTWIEYGLTTTYGSSRTGVPAGAGDCVFGADLVDLMPGTTYHYRVLAWDRVGGLNIGGDQEFVTLLGPDLVPPSAPSGLLAWEEGNGIRITWEPNQEDDLVGYYVYRSSRAQDDTPCRTVCLTDPPVSGPSFLDESVEEGYSYRYWVTAADAAGNESGPSDSMEIVMASATAPTLALSAYPNPAPGPATLAFSLPGGVDRVAIRILATSGRVVRELAYGRLQPGDHTVAWDACDESGHRVSAGVYLAELRTPEAVATRKITVLR